LIKKNVKLINKVFKNNNADFVFSELYINNKLSSNRLRILIEKFSDNIYTYSFLVNILLKDNNLELLNIIFENFIYFDNEFVLNLLLHYRNKTVLSKSSLNSLVLNEKKKAIFNRQ